MNKFFDPIERLRALEEMQQEALRVQLEMQAAIRDAVTQEQKHLAHSALLATEITSLRTAMMQQGGRVKADLVAYNEAINPEPVLPEYLKDNKNR